jgi:hypothetical protein
MAAADMQLPGMRGEEGAASNAANWTKSEIIPYHLILLH